MADYSHSLHKFADQGIMLRMPVDLVPANMYSRLTNAQPFIEGQLETRAGLSFIATVLASTSLHTLYHLNQQVTSIVGDRIVGAASRLFVAPLPLGSAFTEQTGFSFSGAPLSIVSFRFDLDQASWAIIGDKNGMRKYRGGSGVPGFYYQKLGITPPAIASVASDDGPGLLDSTGGTDFDWRYTYLNGVTGSESNGSPQMYNPASTNTNRPTANIDPDPNFGGVGFTNPANAYDANPATFASGIADASVESRQSCLWLSWGASALTIGTLNLIVDAETSVTGTLGTGVATLYYSLDGGTTWNTMFTTSTAVSRQLFNASIPEGTPFGNIQVRAVVLSSGLGTSNDQVDILDQFIRVGGDFNPGVLTSLGLTGHIPPGADRTITMKVYEISTNATISQPVSTLLALVNRQASVCVTPSSDPQVTAIRLYRRGGSRTATWFRVGEFALSSLVIGTCAAGTLQIVDNVPDSALGDPITLDNDVPVTSVSALERPLPFLWGPFDDRVLGCGDPDRPESVYFSKRGNADQWPPQNFIEVAGPGQAMVNGCVFNTRTFAFSHDRMYELIPNLIAGVTFTPFPTPCSRGLISPWGLAVCNAIYFVAKDGIYMSSGGAETSITNDTIQPLFPTNDAPGRSVNGYEAVDMSLPNSIKLRYHNGEVWFTYAGMDTGTLITLIYDVVKQRWRSADYTPEIVTVFSEIGASQSSLLLGSSTGNLYTTAASDDNGSAIDVVFRTGAHDMGVPLNRKELGNVIFDLDPDGAVVTITPYINGEVQVESAINVTGTGRQQVPLPLGDIYAYNVEFEVSWARSSTESPTLYQYDILWRPDPVSVKHWETPPTSHGLPGYMHVRDAYIGIRSTSITTLTVTVDGVANSYLVASTGGERRKVFVPMVANKGKVFQYSLDSDIEFRLYVEDVEVRVKPWLTNFGYAPKKPIGSEMADMGGYNYYLLHRTDQ